MTDGESVFASLAEIEGRDGENFRWRLRWACERVGGVVPLAEEVGIKPPVLRRWLTGPSEPSRLRLVALARSALVAEDWLAGGVGWHFPYRWTETLDAQLLSQPEAFRQRVKRLAEMVGSVVELGRLMDAPESTIRGWIQGPAEPSREMLVRLALSTQVRLQWLLVGHDPISVDAIDPEVSALERRTYSNRYDPLPTSKEGYIDVNAAARQIAIWRANPDQEHQFDRRRKKRRPEQKSAPHPKTAGVSGASSQNSTPKTIGYATHNRTSDASTFNGPQFFTGHSLNADPRAKDEAIMRRVRGLVLDAYRAADLGEHRPENQTWLYDTCLTLLGELGETPACRERLARTCATELLHCLSRVLRVRDSLGECNKA